MNDEEKQEFMGPLNVQVHLVQTNWGNGPTGQAVMTDSEQEWGLFDKLWDPTVVGTIQGPVLD